MAVLESLDRVSLKRKAENEALTFGSHTGPREDGDKQISPALKSTLNERLHSYKTI